MKNSFRLIPNISLLISLTWSLFNPATPALAKSLAGALETNLTSTTVETTDRGVSDIILPPSEIAAEPEPDRVVKAVMTAYTSTPDQTDDTPCITADGTNLCKRGREDVLAANWLPMGTKVKIPSLYGDRVFAVHDRMNKRYGFGRMDIWLNTSKAEARKFGVKRLDVEIYYVKSVKKDREIAKR